MMTYQRDEDLIEDLAERDPHSLGNLLVAKKIISPKQLKKGLHARRVARQLGDKTFRLGDALERMGISRELIEQVARQQRAERLKHAESSTHITAQMAASNIERTEKVAAMAEAIALATPTKQDPER